MGVGLFIPYALAGNNMQSWYQWADLQPQQNKLFNPKNSTRYMLHCQ